MTTDLSYQEISRAIAAMLTKHPQFDKVFTQFERMAWIPIPRGLIKRAPGGSMIAERDKATGKVRIIFNLYNIENGI